MRVRERVCVSAFTDMFPSNWSSVRDRAFSSLQKKFSTQHGEEIDLIVSIHTHMQIENDLLYKCKLSLCVDLKS